MARPDHTPEPWDNLEFYAALRYRDARDHGGRKMFAVMTPLTESREETIANGRRLRAAIRACRGIPTEALEADAVLGLLSVYQEVRSWVVVHHACGHDATVQPGSKIAHSLELVAAILEGRK